MRIPHLISVVICMVGLLVLQNCGPKGDGCEEHEPVHSYYKISDTDKSKIPFTGADTLVYISTDGDTATLYGQGRNEFTEKVAEKWNPDPACSQYDYRYFENIEFTFKGNNASLNSIFIDFNAAYTLDQANADVVIGSVMYHTYFKALNHPLNYIDTVKINSNTYKGMMIYEGYGENDFLPCIYNYQYGFLKITTLNKVWLRKI